MTEWRPVVGFEGLYEVSDEGQVRSMHRRRTKLLRQNGERYLQVMLSPGRHQVTVHSLVARAFHGIRPDGLQIRHLDGNSRNNSAINLCYGTALENFADSVAHGTHKSGEEEVCDHGHPWTGENTYRYPNGRRHCKTCRRESKRQYRERQAVAA